MGLKRRLKKMDKKRFSSYKVFLTEDTKQAMMNVVEEFRLPPLPVFLAMNLKNLDGEERDKACNLMADLARQGKI